jgi:hypothetical protein
VPPPRALAYIVAVSLAAALWLYVLRPMVGPGEAFASLWLYERSGTDLGNPGATVLLAGLGVLTVLAELRPIRLPRSANMSVATAVNFTLVILYGPGWAAMVATAAAALSDVYVRKAWYKTVLNAAAVAIPVGVSASLYFLVYDPHSGPIYSLRNWEALAIYGVTNFGLNTLLVSSAIGLAQGVSPFQIWSLSFRGTALQYSTMIPIGALIATTFLESAYVSAIAMIVLLILVYYALRTSQRLRDEARRTIEAMVDSIDRRDQYTGSHVLGVAEFSRVIAEQLRLPLDEVNTIVLAARIHDLGKVAIPDAVLLKPGPLTDEEMEIMKLHADIGADIIANLSVYNRAREYMRHHHESFDGRGYPGGLVGAQIPFGARILAVADAYQAMTADRPYRRGVPPAIAIERLIGGRGTQWDPRCVDALVEGLSVKAPAPALVPEPK